MKKGKEFPQSRYASTVASVGDIAAAALLKEAMDNLVINLVQRFFFQNEEQQKKTDVGVIGLNRVFGKTLFSDYEVEKKLFCRNKLLWEGFSGDGRVNRKR